MTPSPAPTPHARGHTPSTAATRYLRAMAQAATDCQLAHAPLPPQATITVPQSLSAWPAIIEYQAAHP